MKGRLKQSHTRNLAERKKKVSCLRVSVYCIWLSLDPEFLGFITHGQHRHLCSFAMSRLLSIELLYQIFYSNFYIQKWNKYGILCHANKMP